ncbi:SLOG family protein, partial [Lactobacillus taiwanensis]
MKRLWVTGYRSYELSIFSDKDPKLAVIKYA